MPEEVLPKPTEEEAMEQVYKKIVEIKGSDYWIIRLKKKTVLLIAGGLILLMWGVIGGRWLLHRFPGRITIKNNMIVIEQPVNPNDLEPTVPKLSGPYIRIRNTTLNEAGAATMAQFLKDRGYQRVEVVADKESTVSGVLVVTKTQNEALRRELVAALAQTYHLTSPSAQLTEDSDLDAVIFYGIKARL